MKTLPAQLHGAPRGNHQTAIDRTSDIHRYVDRALASLAMANDESAGSHIRGGHLREADELLDAIKRYADCAKGELRIAHCQK